MNAGEVQQGRCLRSSQVCVRTCHANRRLHAILFILFYFIYIYLIFCSWGQVCATRRGWRQGSSFLWQSRAMGVFTAGVLEAVGRYSRQAQPQSQVPEVKSVMH